MTDFDVSPLSRHLGRRRLLLAMAGAFVTPVWAQNSLKEVQEDVYDIIIVGYGAAGAAAAIEAARAGARVLILEKQSQASHCSTSRLSSGIYQCPDRQINTAVLSQYIASTYTPGGAQSFSDGTLDPTLSAFAKTWAKLAPDTFTWLQSLDPEFRHTSSGLYTTPRFMNLLAHYRPHIDVHIATYTKWRNLTYRTYKAPKQETTNGEALYRCLENGIKAYGNIQVRYDARALELLTKDGVVTGVSVAIKGAETIFRARKGVILASGGFAFHQALRAALLPPSANPFWAASGSPANTGDALTMAQRLGAALISTSAYFDRFCLLLPDKINGTRLGIALDCIGNPHSILVDNFGKRFVPESDLSDREHHYGFTQKLLEFDPATLSFPRLPTWLIFDETMRQHAPLATIGEGTTANGLLPWSLDNLDAVKRGWILKGATLEALAAKIAAHPDNKNRMQAANLMHTVERFNRFTQDKRDADFDRSPATMGAVSKPPFYAMPVSVDIPHMAVGLKTNANRQVVTWRDTPIKGLYAAGEAAPISRFVHDRGGHLSECLVFGRFVGKLVAGLPARTVL